MASRLFFNPMLPNLHTMRTPLFAASIGVSTCLLIPGLLQTYRTKSLHKLESSPSPSTSSKDWSFSNYQSEAQTPLVSRNGGLNARAVKQLSAGSIMGLVAGLGVSVFSKPLALLIGLLVVGLQTAERYGIRLIPYQRMQKYFKSIDLRSAMQDNVAFKISFGMMFALSAFAEF